MKPELLEYEITVPRWDEFQHYSKGTIWIKLYCRLGSDRDFLRLTFAQRGLLASIWVEYARANHGRPVDDTRALHGDTAELTRTFGQRVSGAQLQSLNHAGFITLSSRPALEQPQNKTRPEEKRREENNQTPSPTTNVVPIREKPPAVEGFTLIGELVPDVLERFRRGAA